VRALRFGDLADPVFLFVGFDVFPSRFDFLVAGNAKAVVIVAFFSGIGPFMRPNSVGIRVLSRPTSAQ
jgi:hypothetical protein